MSQTSLKTIVIAVILIFIIVSALLGLMSYWPVQ